MSRSYIPSLIFILVGAAAGVLIWQLVDDDSAARIIGSVLVFLGVALTGAITLAVHNVRTAIEERTLALQRDAEARLGSETALKAVALLGTPDGTPASSAQAGGALVTLAILGHHQLAIALTRQHWQSGYLDSGSIELVADEALASNVSSAQISAAGLLLQAAPDLLMQDGFHWPASQSPDISSALPAEVRSLLTRALIRLATQPAVVEGAPAHAVVMHLASAARTEASTMHGGDAARVVAELLSPFPGAIIYSNRKVQVEAVIEEMQGIMRKHSLERSTMCEEALDAIRSIRTSTPRGIDRT